MKKENKRVQTMSYLRVSTEDQNTEKNKADVLKYANEHDFGKVDFVTETASGKKSWKDRLIKGIIDDLSEGDRIIVPELSRLGRSTLEVLEILKTAKEKGIAVYSVKERLELNGDSINSKIMATMLSLFSELERDFISMRTKEGLKAVRASGVQLGRPKGPGKSKKFDEHREEIIALLKNGSSKAFIAKRYGSSVVNLFNWLKKNDIHVVPEI
jgi:DNA invertase Pin-like site-specific DNA recombinase